MPHAIKAECQRTRVYDHCDCDSHPDKQKRTSAFASSFNLTRNGLLMGRLAICPPVLINSLSHFKKF